MAIKKSTGSIAIQDRNADLEVRLLRTSSDTEEEWRGFLLKRQEFKSIGNGFTRKVGAEFVSRGVLDANDEIRRKLVSVTDQFIEFVNGGIGNLISRDPFGALLTNADTNAKISER
jgi:hypothetical protein